MLMRQHGKQGRDGNGYGISSQDQSGRSAQYAIFRWSIDTLLRASGPMSRSRISAKETGLTKATMSLPVSLLIDAGVVKEGEPQNSASYGRPSTPLMLGGGKVCGIGMQVNTDGYGCMALDINHDILRHEWVDADMSGVEPDVVFGKLDAMAKAMAEDLGIEAMHHRGRLVCAAGLGHLR